MKYGRGFEGANYQATKDLDITDVAKLIRADIKAAQKNGELPKGRISVRINRYSGGQSINIELKDVVTTRGSAVFAHTLDKLKRIGESYNRDDSDPMTDYCSVKFFVHAYVWTTFAENLTTKPR